MQNDLEMLSPRSPLSRTPSSGTSSPSSSTHTLGSESEEVEEHSLSSTTNPTDSPVQKGVLMGRDYRGEAIGAFNVGTTSSAPRTAHVRVPGAFAAAAAKSKGEALGGRQRKVGISDKDQVVLLDFGEDVEAEEAEDRRANGEGEAVDESGQPIDKRTARVVSSSILAADSTAHPVAKLLARFNFEYSEEDERAERDAYVSLTKTLCGPETTMIFRNPDDATSPSPTKVGGCIDSSMPDMATTNNVCTYLAEREEEVALLRHLKSQRLQPPPNSLLCANAFRKALWLSLNQGRMGADAEQALKALPPASHMFHPSQIFIPAAMEEERLFGDVADRQSIRELRLVQFLRNLKQQAPVSGKGVDDEAPEAALRRAGVQGWNLTAVELAICEAIEQFMNLVGVAEGLGQPYGAESGDGRNRHLMARYGIAHFKRETDRKILEYRAGDGDPRSIAGAIVLRHRIPRNYASVIAQKRRETLIKCAGGSKRNVGPETISHNEIMVATTFGAIRKRGIAGGAASQAGGGEEHTDTTNQPPVHEPLSAVSNVAPSDSAGTLRTVMDLSDLHTIFTMCTTLQLTTAQLLLDEEARDIVASKHDDMAAAVQKASRSMDSSFLQRSERRSSAGTATALVNAQRERRKSIMAQEGERADHVNESAPPDVMDEAAAYISKRQSYLEQHSDEINCSHFVRGVSVYLCALTAMQMRVGFAEKELMERRKAALLMERKIREHAKEMSLEGSMKSAGSFRADASFLSVSPAASMTPEELRTHRQLCSPAKFEKLIHNLRIRYKRAMMKMALSNLRELFIDDVDNRIGGDNENLFDKLFTEEAVTQQPFKTHHSSDANPTLVVDDGEMGGMRRVDSMDSAPHEPTTNAVPRKRIEAAQRRGKHAKRMLSYGASDQAVRTASAQSCDHIHSTWSGTPTNVKKAQDGVASTAYTTDEQTFAAIFAAMVGNSPLYSFNFDVFFRNEIERRLENTKSLAIKGSFFSQSETDSGSATSSDEEDHHVSLLLDEVVTSPTYFFELSKRVDFMAKGGLSTKKGLYMLFCVVDSSDRRRISWSQLVNFLFEAALVERKGAIDLDRKNYELAETVTYGKKSFVPTLKADGTRGEKPFISLLQRRRQQRERFATKSLAGSDTNMTVTTIEAPQNLTEIFYFRPTGQLILGGTDLHIVARTRKAASAVADDGVDAAITESSESDVFPVKLTVPTPRDVLSKHPLYSILAVDYNESMRMLAVSCTDSTIRFYLVSGCAAAGSDSSSSSGAAVVVPKLVHTQPFDCNQTSIAFFKEEMFCGGRDGSLTCLQLSYRFSRGFIATIKPQQPVKMLGQDSVPKLIQSGRQFVSCFPHSHVIRRIIVVRHESCIVTCSFDHKMLMIDTRSLRVVHSFTADAPDSLLELSGMPSGNDSDGDDGSPQRGSRSEKRGIVDVAYSELLNVLVSISFAGAPLVWSLSTLNRCKPSKLIDTVRPHNALLVSVQCIDYNHRTAATLDKRGMVKLWDIKELRCLQTVQLGSHLDRGGSFSAVDAASNAEIRLKKEQFRKAAVSSAMKSSFGNTGSGTLESMGGGDTTSADKSNTFVKLIHHYDPPSAKTPLGEHVLYVMDKKRLYALRYNYSQSRVILRNTADDGPILNATWNAADQCYMTIAPSLTRVWDGDTSAVRDTFQCTTVEECGGTTSGSVHPSGRQLFLGCTDGTILAKNTSTGITLHTRRQLHTLPFHDDRMVEVNVEELPQTTYSKEVQLPVRQVLYCAAPRPKGQGADPSLDVVASLSEDLVIITDGEMKNAFALTAPTATMTRSLPQYTSDTLETSVHKTNAPSKHDTGVLIYKDATELKKGLESPRCMAFDGEHSHILMVGDTHGCITLFQLGRSQAPCRSGPVGITAFPKATPRAVTCILPIPIALADDKDSELDAGNSYFVASDDEGAIALFALVRPFPCLALWKHVGEDKPTSTVRVVNKRDMVGSLHDVVPLRPPTVTCMYYSRDRSLLYVGDDGGKITIYNLTDTLASLAKRLTKKVAQPAAPPLSAAFSGFSAFGDVGDGTSLMGGRVGLSRMSSSAGNESPSGDDEPDTGTTFGELCADMNPYITGSMVVVVNRWAAHLDAVTSLNVVQKTTTLSSDLDKISSLFTPAESATKRTKSFFTREQQQLSTQTTLLVSSSLDHCVYGWSVAGSTYLGALEQYGRCVIVPPTVVEVVRRITALESLQRVALLDRRYLKGSTGLPDLDEAITARGSIGDADLFVDPLRVGDPSTNDFLYIASHRELHQRDARIDMLKIKRRGLVRSVGMRCIIDIPHHLRTVGPDTSLTITAEALLGRAAASLNTALAAHSSDFPTIPFLTLAAAEGSVSFYNSLSRCLAVPLGGRSRGTFGYFTLADKIGTALYEGARRKSVRRRSSNSVTHVTTREVYLAGVPVAPPALDPPQWMVPSCTINPRRLPFKSMTELPPSLQRFLVSLPLSIIEQLVNASEGSRGSFRGEAPRALMTPSLWDTASHSVPARLLSKSNILARSGRPAALHDPNTVHGAIQQVCSEMQDAEIRAEGRTGGAQLKDAAALDDILHHEESSDDDRPLLSPNPSPTCGTSPNIRAHPEKDIVSSAKAFIASMVGQHQRQSMSPKRVVPPALLPNQASVPARRMTPGEQAHRPKHMMELVEEHQRQVVMSKEKGSRPRGGVPTPSDGEADPPLRGFQPMLPAGTGGAESASLLPDESVVMSMLYRRGGGEEWGADLSTIDKPKDTPAKKKVLFRGNGLLEFPAGTFDLCDISRPELKGQKNSPRSDSDEEAVAALKDILLSTRSRQKRPHAERQRLPLRMAGDLAIVAAAKYSEVEEERRKKEAAVSKRRELRRRNKRYDGALEQMSDVLAIRQIDSDEELELREAIRSELIGAPTRIESHRAKGMKRGGSFTAKSGARMRRLLLHQHNSPNMSSYKVSQRLDPSLGVDLNHSVTDIESDSGLLSFPSDDQPLVPSSDESIDPKWFEDPPPISFALDRVDAKLDAIRVAVGSSKTKSEDLSNASSARNQIVARAVTTLKNGGRGEGRMPSVVVFQSEGSSVGAYLSGRSKERLLTNKDASMTARSSSVGILTPLGLRTSTSVRPMSTTTPLPSTSQPSQISPPLTNDAHTVHHMRALQPRRTLPIGAARRDTK